MITFEFFGGYEIYLMLKSKIMAYLHLCSTFYTRTVPFCNFIIMLKLTTSAGIGFDSLLKCYALFVQI